MQRYKRKHRLDASLKGWIVNTARANLWKVRKGGYELDDLIQEGYWCYARIASRYPHIEEQRHFMSLVQRCFNNQIYNIAKDVDAMLDRMAPPEGEATSLYMALRQLPAELKQLMRIIAGEAAELPFLTRPDRTRETTNEHYCRLIGADPKEVNLERELRSFLSDGERSMDYKIRHSSLAMVLANVKGAR